MTEPEPKRGRGRPSFAPDDRREMRRLRLPARQMRAFEAKAERLGLTITEAMEQAAGEWLAKAE